MSGYVIEAESQAYYDAVMRLIKAVEDGTDPEGANVERGLLDMGNRTERYASSITHQWTATLYRSYLVNTGSAGGKGVVTVYVDPNAMNPYGQRPAVYAEYEFRRGGSHDAFGRAYRQANPAYVISGIEVILNGIKE